MSELYRLLNNVSADPEEYEGKSLSELETKRIKKTVLREISNRKKQKKTAGLSLLKACVCAVLVLSVGGIGIAAASGRLPMELRNLFHIDSAKKLQTADKMGKALSISAEDAGIRITAEGVMRDQKHVGIVYKIERMNGGTLDPKGRKCTGVEFDALKCIDSDDNRSMSGSQDILKQEESADYVRYYTVFDYDKEVNEKLQITMSDMKLWFGGRQESGTEFNGNWSLNISTGYKDCSVELASGQELQFGKEKATLEELSVSPMGYYLEISSKESFEHRKWIKKVDGRISLYLKNGDVIALDGSNGPVIPDDGTWSFRIRGNFDKMILLDEMEKIKISNFTFKF